MRKDCGPQGTFQFTWHGYSNVFQASFIVTDAEMQGAPLGSAEFTNSVSVSSLSGITYNSHSDDTLFLGNVNPWTLSFTFLDFNHNTEVFVGAVTFPIGGMAGDIREKPMSGSDWFYERGFWTYSAIPEPGSAVLLALGALCVLRRPRRPPQRITQLSQPEILSNQAAPTSTHRSL
jgi:hypothetical protein